MQVSLPKATDKFRYHCQKMKKISSQGLLIVNAFGPSKVKTPCKRKAENVITKECILEEIKAAKRKSGKAKVKVKLHICLVNCI